MKKFSIITILFATIFAGCSKDEPDVVSTVVSVTHPGITLNGPQYVHILKGGAYTEFGAVLTDDLTGAQTSIQPIESDLNKDSTGMYKVVYEARNSNGFKTRAVRTILVLDYTPAPGLDTTFDLSGEYERQGVGTTLTINKVNQGLYIINKVGASTDVPVYMITPDTTTINIPAQTSFDYFPVDVVNEVIVAGTQYTIKYNVIADGFGTSTRTFVRL